MSTKLAIFTQPLCPDIKGDPPCWPVHCNSFYILQVIQARPRPDKKFNGCIGVIGEDIQVDGKFLCGGGQALGVPEIDL